jgi:hypothetical protein
VLGVNNGVKRLCRNGTIHVNEKTIVGNILPVYYNDTEVTFLHYENCLKMEPENAHC